jgi:hypothetical protein
MDPICFFNVLSGQISSLSYNVCEPSPLAMHPFLGAFVPDDPYHSVHDSVEACPAGADSKPPSF